MSKTLKELQDELELLKAKQVFRNTLSAHELKRRQTIAQINRLKYAKWNERGKSIKLGFKNIQKSGIGKRLKRISRNAARNQRRSNSFGMPNFKFKGF